MSPHRQPIAAIHGTGEFPSAPSTGTLVAWAAILTIGGLLFWGAMQDPKPVKMKSR